MVVRLSPSQTTLRYSWSTHLVRGQKISSLYVLKGSIVTDTVAISSTIMEPEPKSDGDVTTTWWIEGTLRWGNLGYHDDAMNSNNFRVGVNLDVAYATRSHEWMIVLDKRGPLLGAGIGKLDFYEHSVYGKQTRVCFSSSEHRMKGTLDYINSDL